MIRSRQESEAPSHATLQPYIDQTGSIAGVSYPWRVLIADERLPLRARLRKLLEADPGFAVSARSPTAPLR